MYVTIPNRVRVPKATEAVLNRIYDAARQGLKGDTLALAAGMLPSEYRLLCELDEQAMIAAMKGKADSEMEHAALLAAASRNGNAQASLAILQHVHGWVAKKEIDITTHQGADIKELLASREARMATILDGECSLVEDASASAPPPPPQLVVESGVVDAG